MRTAEIRRTTAETDVTLTLALDGAGRADVATGVGFLDHMLTLLAVHGGFDLTLSCTGDTGVDDHHTVEDVGICLGMAFAKALGDKRGVARYGQRILPMDEALVLAVADLSGRAYLGYDLTIPAQKVGTFDTELVQEFWLAFTRKAELTLHLRQLAGVNSHHIIEGAFKAAARCLAEAVAVVGEGVPSSKGVL